MLFQKGKNGQSGVENIYTGEVGHSDLSSNENFFEDELSEHSENFLKLLIEHIDYLVQHQKYANIKKILVKKTDFINKLKQNEIKCYLYLKAVKALAELKNGMDGTAVARFIEIKSLSTFDDKVTEAIQNDASDILSDEKLIGSMDHFESELTKSIRKLESFADRYYIWSPDAPLTLRELTLLNAFKVLKISCGNSHMLFLAELSDNQNCLFGIGDNYSKQIFKNTEIKTISKPSLIVDYENSNFIDITAQGDCSFAITKSKGYCWGKQVFEVDVQSLISTSHTLKMAKVCATRDKMIIAVGKNNEKSSTSFTATSYEFFTVEMETRLANKIGCIQDEIKQISCGFEHMMILTTRGKLYGFGHNDQHQLSESNSLDFGSQIRPIDYFSQTTVQSICCFGQHTTVVDISGQAYVFGKLPNKSRINRSHCVSRNNRHQCKSILSGRG